jgi:hypothetical protein
VCVTGGRCRQGVEATCVDVVSGPQQFTRQGRPREARENHSRAAWLDRFDVRGRRIPIRDGFGSPPVPRPDAPSGRGRGGRPAGRPCERDRGGSTSRRTWRPVDVRRRRRAPAPRRAQARSVPPSHDITTDTEEPPPFVALQSARAAEPNKGEYALLGGWPAALVAERLFRHQWRTPRGFGQHASARDGTRRGADARRPVGAGRARAGRGVAARLTPRGGSVRLRPWRT